MKKYYLFAALATAGLFASCSSEDAIDVVQPTPVVTLDENDPVKIEIGLAQAEVSRGTGALGSTTVGNQWEGQIFSVLMTEKGTALGAYADNERTTPIFKGLQFSVDQTTTGNTPIALEDVTVYYPTTDAEGNLKVYDFWAYRLDGSEVLNGGEVQYNGLDDENADQVTIPFEIDGTQDLMVAKTIPSATGVVEDALIYSSKSARKAVKPTFSFSHLLTQLKFKVKAYSEDMTASGDGQYEITNITVKSKSTGELIVANLQDVANEERIIWDGGEANFNLMTRQMLIDETADIQMVEISVMAGEGFNAPYAAGYEDENGNTSYTVPSTALFEALTVYDSGDIDSDTGLPTGNKTTIGALKADKGAVASVHAFILTYKSGTHTDGTTLWNVPTYQATAAGAASELVTFKDNTHASSALTWDAVNNIGDKIEVGAPMLVAPADEEGYEVFVHFNYQKRTSSTTFATAEAVSNKVTVKNQQLDSFGAYTVKPFAAGASYNVTITLYPQGEAGMGEVDVTPWEEGGDLDAAEE